MTKMLRGMFFVAASMGWVQNVLYIAHASPGMVENDVDEAFRLACENGRYELVRCMLLAPDKCGLNASGQRDAALVAAAENGHALTVNLLLTQGIWDRTHGLKLASNNFSSFRAAVRGGQAEVLRVMILFSLKHKSGISLETALLIVLDRILYDADALQVIGGDEVVDALLLDLRAGKDDVGQEAI